MCVTSSPFGAKAEAWTRPNACARCLVNRPIQRRGSGLLHWAKLPMRVAERGAYKGRQSQAADLTPSTSASGWAAMDGKGTSHAMWHEEKGNALDANARPRRGT